MSYAIGCSAGFRTGQERASTKVDIKKILRLDVILSVILCKLRYNYDFSTEINR